MPSGRAGGLALPAAAHGSAGQPGRFQPPGRGRHGHTLPREERRALPARSMVPPWPKPPRRPLPVRLRLSPDRHPNPRLWDTRGSQCRGPSSATRGAPARPAVGVSGSGQGALLPGAPRALALPRPGDPGPQRSPVQSGQVPRGLRASGQPCEDVVVLPGRAMRPACPAPSGWLPLPRI